jgi:hypothetical protein
MPTPQIYRFAIISKTDTNLNSNLQKGIDMRKLLCVLLIFAFPTIICADEVDDAIRDAIGAAPPAIAEPEVTEPEITEPEVTIPQPSKKEKIKPFNIPAQEIGMGTDGDVGGTVGMETTTTPAQQRKAIYLVMAAYIGDMDTIS